MKNLINSPKNGLLRRLFAMALAIKVLPFFTS